MELFRFSLALRAVLIWHRKQNPGLHIYMVSAWPLCLIPGIGMRMIFWGWNDRTSGWVFALHMLILGSSCGTIDRPPNPARSDP